MDQDELLRGLRSYRERLEVLEHRVAALETALLSMDGLLDDQEYVPNEWER